MRLLHRNEQVISARPGITYHIDRWTHKLVELTLPGGRTWAIADAPGVSAMRVLRLGAQCHVTLELDDSRNHPVVFASRCKRRWFPPSPRILRSRRLRKTGQTAEWKVLLRMSSGAPIYKTRLARGFSAAVVFADHADQSAPGPLRALLLGRSDASFDKPRGGFVGNGLHLTKTLFARRSPNPQMEDPRVRALARAASARGIELGPHSATPYIDSRSSTEAALKLFKPLGRTWIDHQPDTNCEAFSSRGWSPKSPCFISDLLVKHGFVYVWTGDDMKLPVGINMLLPRRPSDRASFFFPFPSLASDITSREKRLWLFRSVWFYQGPRVFGSRLSPSALASLIRERGIFIAHTYLDAHHPRGHKRHRLALIHRTSGNFFRIHPLVEAVLAHMGRLQRKGLLWVPSVMELGDHLRGVDAVRVMPGPGGALILQNPLGRAVRGLTVRVHGSYSFATGSNRPLTGRSSTAGSATKAAAARARRNRDGTTDIMVDLKALETKRLLLVKPDGSRGELLR